MHQRIVVSVDSCVQSISKIDKGVVGYVAGAYSIHCFIEKHVDGGQRCGRYAEHTGGCSVYFDWSCIEIIERNVVAVAGCVFVDDTEIRTRAHGIVYNGSLKVVILSAGEVGLQQPVGCTGFPNAKARLKSPNQGGGARCKQCYRRAIVVVEPNNIAAVGFTEKQIVTNHTGASCAAVGKRGSVGHEVYAALVAGASIEIMINQKTPFMVRGVGHCAGGIQCR